MVENIVKQETVMEYLVKFVKLLSKQKNQLKPNGLKMRVLELEMQL